MVRNLTATLLASALVQASAMVVVMHSDESPGPVLNQTSWTEDTHEGWVPTIALALKTLWNAIQPDAQHCN